MNQQFDIFLSHNSADKAVIRKIKQLLLKKKLSVWLDEDELQPGINWMPLLEKAICNCRSAGVFVGSNGIGPWEDEETQALLNEAVRNKIPVIPVLLPGNYTKPKLPIFLRNRTYIDMSSGITSELIDKLTWGITGKSPNTSKETTNNQHISFLERAYNLLKYILRKISNLNNKIVWGTVFTAIGAYFAMTGPIEKFYKPKATNISPSLTESSSIQVFIKGEVRDEKTGNGVFNAKVTLPSSQIEATTNEFGSFILKGEILSFNDKEILVFPNNNSNQVLSRKEISQPKYSEPIKIFINSL